MNNPIYKIENLDYKNNNNLLLKIKKFSLETNDTISSLDEINF